MVVVFFSKLRSTELLRSCKLASEVSRQPDYVTTAAWLDRNSDNLGDSMSTVAVQDMKLVTGRIEQ